MTGAKQREQTRTRWLETEMSGRSALERWWGVPGITHAPGHPRNCTDAGLERLRRKYQRGLEDVHAGLANRAAPDEQAQINLEEIEAEQERRSPLRDLWQAREYGTDDYDLFQSAGGLKAAHEGCGLHPSYKLALFMDLRLWSLGFACVFDWSGCAPNGCYQARQS